MPGPLFFKQQRVGKDGRLLNIIKFRSMKVDKALEAAHDFTRDAERMTSFGKLLRRTKIDELPQLWNVLVGDMSLVGPRPTVKEQTDKYNDYQRQRLNMRPGMTERQVQVELEDFMVRHGASGLAFTSIVACGAHGASPHAVSGDTRLEAGQCVVLDFGARAQGYCSDMTRVVFLGEPSAAMRHAYAVLREANETVEAMLLPGVTGAQAHAKAEEILAAGGFAGKMGHGLGHGVGIDIHEQPNLSPRNEKPLVAGNVVTVEPGIYLEGEFGMRLEDFGVITERGFQVFTQSSHEMVII